MYSYWGKNIIDKEGDYELSIEKYLKAIKIFENSVNDRNFDGRMNKTFCSALKSFIQRIPLARNRKNFDYLKEVFLKYDDNITTNNSREYLHELFFKNYGVSLSERNKKSGTVISIIGNRSFSFIRGDDGVDYYAHMKAYRFKGDFYHLKKGMKVDFEVGRNKKGVCAMNIDVK